MEINKNTTFNQLFQNEPYSSFSHDFISNADDNYFKKKMEMTLEDLHKQQPTWSDKDMVYGLQALENARLIRLGQDLHPSLIYLKAQHRTEKPFVLLCAGGAFGAVCTMVESLPVARCFNEMGYDCFTLNYRTFSGKDMFKGLFPKPMEDVATALTYIQQHSSEFNLDISDYILGGFSAGGTLAALFGCDNCGAAHYQLPRPKALLLAYPLISGKNMGNTLFSKIMLCGMYGLSNRKKKLDFYDISMQINPHYPPVYLVRCEDDSTIPAKDSADLKEALAKNRIPYIDNCGKHGAHGFGLGTETSVAGWPQQANKFIHEVLK